MYNLLITFSCTLEFLVGLFKKSTLHLYIPESTLFIDSIVSVAGSAAAWKYARPPKVLSSTQCDPFSKFESRASKL